MFERIMKIIRIIPKWFRSILKLFDIQSNVRILYKSEVIHENRTKASICKVTDQNLKDVCTYEGNKYLGKYKLFLAKGDPGYYAYLDGNWAHRMWFKIGPGVIKRWSIFPPLRLTAHEAYSHFCETAPSARGNNIPAAVLSKAAADLKGKVDCIYTIVDENNYASRRAMEKAGFKEVKRLKRIGFLWLNLSGTLK